MNDLLTSPAFVAAVTALATWVISRATRREDMVGELRKACDRGLRRENALTNVCELLIWAIDQIAEPTKAMIELRARAADVMEAAQAHIYRSGSK